MLLSSLRTAYLDQEWFNLDCSGTLLFLWQSVAEAETATAPATKTTARRESRVTKRSSHAQAVERRRESALEAAARCAITFGPRAPPVEAEPEVLGADTPRTFRSDPKDPKKRAEEVQLVSPQLIRDALDKAFQHMKRAAVSDEPCCGISLLLMIIEKICTTSFQAYE